jgi:hypothetical protein
MAQITAYCAEAQGLRLGPGTGNVPIKGELIVFQGGYAEFDEADYPNWQSWLAGAPHIEILDTAHGEIGPLDAEFVCDKCGKGFATKKALNGHLMSHKPKRSK